MGYYLEVGIGCEQNIIEAMGWYEQAANRGNKNAMWRIAELAKGSARVLTRREHEANVENKLLRKRMEAKARSELAAR